MSKGRTKNDKARAIVIRREEVVGGGHHGGAWKVAYADFVTAMMAFFLLMWLINATSDKQRRGIADYFSPEGVHARSLSGSGKPFGGTTPFDKGSLVSNLGSVSVTGRVSPSADASAGGGDPDAIDPPPPPPPPPPAGTATGEARADAAASPAVQRDPDAVPINGSNHLDGNAGRGTASTDDGTAGDPSPIRPVAATAGPGPDAPPASEEAAFRLAAGAIRRAVAADRTLDVLPDQITATATPEGLRIQIVDTEHRPMFDDGSVVPNARARRLLAIVAPVIASLDAPVSITGHTDSTPPLGDGSRSNWALSAARADATRMVLEAGGLPDARVVGVTGVADREPLVRGDGGAAENRRVVMFVRRRATAPIAAAAPSAPFRSPAASPAALPR